MARKKQDQPSADEKKLRRRLKKAEQGYQKAQEQVRKARVSLGKATTRLARREADLAETRAALETLVAGPTPDEGSVLPPEREAVSVSDENESALETVAAQPADMDASDVAGALAVEASPVADIEVAGQVGGAVQAEPAPAEGSALEIASSEASSPDPVPARPARRSRRSPTAGQEASGASSTPEGSDAAPSAEERAEALGLIVP